MRPVPPVVRLVTFVDLDCDGTALSLSARHDAVLADGRRIVLLDDRGWSGALRDSLPQDEVVRTARMVVGPDAPFEGQTQAGMEADHWNSLARKLRLEGIEIDVDELKALPHDVQMSDRVMALIRDGSAS